MDADGRVASLIADLDEGIEILRAADETHWQGWLQRGRDQIARGDAHGLDDSFAVLRSGSDPRSAEHWARDGFERLPSSSRRFGLLAHRWLLGFHLGPFTSVDHIFGWRIVTSRPELLHLQAQGPRLTGHSCGRSRTNA